MSFFSGLSNIFHGIGNFFDGGDDDQKKRQQQQFNPAPAYHAPAGPQYQPQQNNASSNPGDVVQPQKQDPFLNLLQPGNTGLKKATPNAPATFAPVQTPAPAPAAPQPAKPHASIIHDITHNPITDIAGTLVKLPVQFSEDYSNTAANLGNRLAGGKDQTIQQNMGGDPLNDRLVKWSGATGQNKQLLGDTAQIGLTALAPGIDNAVEGATGAAVDRFLPSLTDTAAENLTKYGSRFLTGGTINTGFSGASELGSGESTSDVLKKAPGNFAVGGVIGEAAPPVLGGLRKFTGKMVSALRGEPNVPAPDELATGIKSANPTQAADAAKAHVESVPQPPPLSVEQLPATELQKAATDLNAPAYQRIPLKAAAADEAATARTAAEEQAAPTQPTDAPTFQHKQAIQAVVEQGNQELTDFVNQHPEATPQDIETARQSIAQQVTDHVQQLNDARYGTVEPTPAPATTLQPAVAPEAAPAGAAVPTPSVPAEAAPPQPVAASAEPVLAPAQSPVAPELPVEQSGTPANPGAKNARFNQAVIDNAKDPIFKDAFESDPVEKDGAPLSQLNEGAIAKVQQMSLPELVMQYGKDYTDAGPVTTPAAYYEHLQALRELEKYAGDPTAADAAANALRAVNDYAYRQGRGLAATKVAYDNMPTSMKVAYIQKLVQKAGGDLAEADLKRLFNAADLQGQFAKTAADAAHAASELAATADKADPAFNDNMKKLLATEMEAKGNLYDQNHEVVDIMNKNMPPSALDSRIAQSARTMMLSSVGGRAFALTSTGANFANYAADKTLSSVFGRVINGVNKLRGSEAPAVKTSFARPTTLAKGAVKGVKGLYKESFGTAPVKDVEQAAQGKFYDSEYSHDATRYGKLGGITAPFRKAVRFGVGSHLALTKGAEDVELEQAARQVIKEQNIPKANQKGFVDYYKQHAPRDVAEEAKQVHLGINNLHQNGWSDKVFGNIASGLDKIPVVGKQFRTVVMPFSRFMGGYVDKMLTDRNAFYNMYRIARARSPQELSDNLARLVTNVGTGVGIGYMGAKSGLITNKDANGDSYDGLYFHIGNRYIPVAIAGQAAAPIIMGATFHQSLNSPGGVKTWPTGVADNLTKATGVAGTFGSDTGPTQIFTGNSSKGAPALAGTAVRQHIPGFLGDINSGLDYSSLNPTHEKALTKATNKNPATGRDVTDNVQTEINKTKAAIPGLSQELPRDTGVTAKDFADRALHSTHSSSTQLQKAKDDKVAADQATADKQNDIPNPAKGAYNGTNDTYEQALQARLERGEYDKVITSIQQDVKQQQGDKNVAPSTLDKLNNKVKQFTVAKGAKLSYSDMQLYNSTSVSEWRKMGDSTSDSYDPDTYQKLWNVDKALADQGVAGGFLIGDAKTTPSDKQKYSAKQPGKGSSRSAGNRAARNAADLIKGNTIGSTPELKNISFGNLAPVKLDNFKIPTIQQIPSSQLVKKRTISVGKAT